MLANCSDLGRQEPIDRSKGSAVCGERALTWDSERGGQQRLSSWSVQQGFLVGKRQRDGGCLQLTRESRQVVWSYFHLAKDLQLSSFIGGEGGASLPRTHREAPCGSRCLPSAQIQLPRQDSSSKSSGPCSIPGRKGNQACQVLSRVGGGGV